MNDQTSESKINRFHIYQAIQFDIHVLGRLKLAHRRNISLTDGSVPCEENPSEICMHFYFSGLFAGCF